MATFSAIEERLGRMVGEAVRRGVPESAFGLGGMRTVGPLVTLQTDDHGKVIYRTNGTPGLTLGHYDSEARESIFRIYRKHGPGAT